MRQELLGQLHTLKGEARMLGMGRLASLSHALEEQLLGEHFDFSAFRAVVDAVSLALAESTPEAESHELLLTAAEALGVETGAGEPDEEVVVDEASGPVARQDEETRWMQVDAALVEKLGESLAALSVGFSKHVTQVQAAGLGQEAALAAEEMRVRLQDALTIALELRLAGIEPLLASLAAHIRVLCQQRSKPVNVTVRAQGVRAEREVLEMMREPLLHLCTNAVAHGLEAPSERGNKAPEGSITLTAESSNAGVVVTVGDDGKGIQVPHSASSVDQGTKASKYDFLFQPGFSTSESTDEVSGRGVGLDVVKRNIEALGGSVRIESEVGQGSSFSIFAPSLLTQQDVVAFEVDSTLYGVPAQSVLSIQSAENSEQESLKFDSEVLPLRSLSSCLGMTATSEEAHVLILRLGGKLWGLRVGNLKGHFEVIRRTANSAFRERTGVEASAQLQDGQLLLILSSQYLTASLHAGGGARGAQVAALSAVSSRACQRVLVVDDSVVVRDLIGELLLSSGYEVEKAENGIRALEEIKRFDPGLVISDIEMPEMDGFELLGEIRKTSATLPVVLLTARSSVKDRQRASAQGANAYVAKGEFQRDTLVAIIDRYYPKIS